MIQLTGIDGYAAAVYDGHGGWQVVNIPLLIVLIMFEKTVAEARRNHKEK